MARIDVTQATVLERIVERLRSELDLPEQRCYETLDADSPLVVPPGGEFFITVSPGEGQFVPGEQAVGNVTEEWRVNVAVFARIHLDQSGRDLEVLLRAGRGMLAIKRDVLAALVGHDLVDDDGNTFLRNLLYIMSVAAPRVMERGRESGALTLYQMTIEVGVEFDWELT